MAGDAADGSASLAVVARHVTQDAASDRALDAALGRGGGGARRQAGER